VFRIVLRSSRGIYLQESNGMPEQLRFALSNAVEHISQPVSPRSGLSPRPLRARLNRPAEHVSQFGVEVNRVEVRTDVLPRRPIQSHGGEFHGGWVITVEGKGGQLTCGASLSAGCGIAPVQQPLEVGCINQRGATLPRVVFKAPEAILRTEAGYHLPEVSAVSGLERNRREFEGEVPANSRASRRVGDGFLVSVIDSRRHLEVLEVTETSRRQTSCERYEGVSRVVGQ
jgi:hypothetical protein